ncbi:MAG: glutamine--fructose-6-phosphate transaminase (isomerizing) [Peptoniphilaceae bacterium]|nr:glutamine--fructose-6-phosphate transaminase (isomerizing) [Peptoniphilaceae bacterium]MDD7383913.1 glutamine--fructose-6-phosphate transaminase (isomerizing) [Peptoniphilaceae bacterium]MDY3738056.1 glutamine--fructose-6-phosphate transaminase (isomerizing) [Peptoniphilaceae bacterium]
MCGIVCYMGKRNAKEIILEGLKSLEYRGYDSSGISVLVNGKLKTYKKAGKLDELNFLLKNKKLNSNIGIGHIRWATHGKADDINAHPHVSYDGRISVVHNGIIENYSELKKFLKEKGFEFKSSTDTEVVSNLISYFYKDDLLDAVFKSVELLKGSFALGIISNDENRLIAVRNESPLILGIGENEFILSSDVSSIAHLTKNVIYLKNMDIVDIKKNYSIYNNRKKVEREIERIDIELSSPSKEGYDFFMQKEIYEQPDVIRKNIKSYINNFSIDLKNSFSKDEIKNFNKIYIVACGSAYNAGVVSSYVFEKYAKIPVICDIASEFRYKINFLDEKSLVILISQSGETADTLAVLRNAKKYNAKTLAIVNVYGSSIAREADKTLFINAGNEIAVASTKAYSAQILITELFALDFAYKFGKIEKKEIENILKELKSIPEKIEIILNKKSIIEDFSNIIKNKNHIFYLGRGLDYFSAKEGALKLKEISYIHAESFPAGELKHGTIALIEKDTPIVAISTDEKLTDKMVSNVEEVSARGAFVFSICTEKSKKIEEVSNMSFVLPKTIDIFYPIFSVIVEQLLAYYTSKNKGLDVDKPRNLAKSVTVE